MVAATVVAGVGLHLLPAGPAQQATTVLLPSDRPAAARLTPLPAPFSPAAAPAPSPAPAGPTYYHHGDPTDRPLIPTPTWSPVPSDTRDPVTYFGDCARYGVESTRHVYCNPSPTP